MTSAYRSPEVNKRVGGSKTSQHVQAQAADLMGYGRSDRVSEAERGIGAIEPARWSLYLLAVGQHPAYRLVRRSAQISA